MNSRLFRLEILVKNLRTLFFMEMRATKKQLKSIMHMYGGYHYIEVLNQKNFEPAYKVAYLTKAIVAK